MLAATNSGTLESIKQVLEADAEARRIARERVADIKKSGTAAGYIFCVISESNQWESTYLDYV